MSRYTAFAPSAKQRKYLKELEAAEAQLTLKMDVHRDSAYKTQAFQQRRGIKPAPTGPRLSAAQKLSRETQRREVIEFLSRVTNRRVAVDTAYELEKIGDLEIFNELKTILSPYLAGRRNISQPELLHLWKAFKKQFISAKYLSSKVSGLPPSISSLVARSAGVIPPLAPPVVASAAPPVVASAARPVVGDPGVGEGKLTWTPYVAPPVVSASDVLSTALPDAPLTEPVKTTAIESKIEELVDDFERWVDLSAPLTVGEERAELRAKVGRELLVHLEALASVGGGPFDVSDILTKRGAIRSGILDLSPEEFGTLILNRISRVRRFRKLSTIAEEEKEGEEEEEEKEGSTGTKTPIPEGRKGPSLLEEMRRKRVEMESKPKKTKKPKKHKKPLPDVPTFLEAMKEKGKSLRDASKRVLNPLPPVPEKPPTMEESLKKLLDEEAVKKILARRERIATESDIEEEEEEEWATGSGLYRKLRHARKGCRPSGGTLKKAGGGFRGIKHLKEVMRRSYGAGNDNPDLQRAMALWGR
jgi:hypothetical protein